MKRAMMFPIHKKFSDMIFDGSKDDEFRNKLPKHLKKGMKIYLYEVVGKKHQKTYISNVVKTWTDGLGEVVGEFTVGEIYLFRIPTDGEKRYAHILESHELRHDKKEEFPNGYKTSCCRSKRDFEEWGYDNHKYAIEITNVIKYDEDWQSEQLSNLDYDWVEEPPMIKKLENAPTSPIPKEEFANWNRYHQFDKELGSHGWIYPVEEKLELSKVKSSPQSPIYVVEKEV